MDENKLPLFDWNQLSVDECVAYLKNKHLLSSKGEAKCIFELINAYEQLKTEKMYNKQVKVINAIIGERHYQNEMIAKTERPDMIEDLHIGDTIAAMEHNLSLARAAWYQGSTPHQGAMEYIRKVCGLGVQAGEKYGMPNREVLTPNSLDEMLTQCKETGNVVYKSECKNCTC